MCPIFVRRLESVEAQRMAAIFCLRGLPRSARGAAKFNSSNAAYNRTSRANLRLLTDWQTEPLANAVGLRKKKKLL
jgi:hypothetical protein